MNKITISPNENSLDVFKDENLEISLNERTLKDNFIEIFSKREAEDYFHNLIEGTPVATVKSQLNREYEKVYNSTEELILIDTFKQVSFSTEAEISSILSFLKSYQENRFNFLTLIDEAESTCDEEFIYAQFPLYNGSICEYELIDEVYNLLMVNEETNEYYYREEIEVLSPYSVLLNHFVLRKDKYRLEPSEY